MQKSVVFVMFGFVASLVGIGKLTPEPYGAPVLWLSPSGKTVFAARLYCRMMRRMSPRR